MFQRTPAARRRRAAHFHCDPLEARRLLATFAVTSTADAGAGTLREAIVNANSVPGADTITFNLSPAGVVHTISPATLLPAITGPTLIDGRTQPGFTPGRPLIQLSGNLSPAGGNGLMLQNATGSVIRSLIINRFANHGVILSGGANVTMEGNWIGLDSAGAAAAPNRIGVLSNAGGSRFGGATLVARNVVSGNTEYGLQLEGNDNVVTGNYIGTNSSGATAVANGIGVNFRGSRNRVGGLAAGEGNVISGNRTGVRIGVESVGQPDAINNVVAGNFIGTQAIGTGRLANSEHGVWIMGAAATNIIGGTSPAAGNLISGNGIGVLISAAPPQAGSAPLPPRNNRVEGNVIGLNGNRAPLGNSIAGVSITAGTGNVVGGTTTGTRNTISGNNTGVRIEGAATNNNFVQGNYIGLRPDGTAASVGNSTGVWIEGAGANTIGGTAAGNVISESFSYGIFIYSIPTSASPPGNTIQGNLIGTDPSGTLDLGNNTGIEIMFATGTLIGGPTPGARNVISGSNSYGVRITASSTRVQGNYIGTNAAGTAALRNGFGVSIAGGSAPGSSLNFVGGENAGEGNLISGNGTGVQVSGANAVNNFVQGNLIGTNAAGTGAVPNTGVGVHFRSVAFGTIGGSAAGARNIISGNGGHGVYLEQCRDVTVQNNYVGVNRGGTGAVGNALSGVWIGVIDDLGGDGNNQVHDNLISGNRWGVTIADADGNFVFRNSIGLNASGNAPIPNTGPGAGNGIDLSGAAARNVIGGPASQPTRSNVIAGNDGHGVTIGFAATDNVVEGNDIGYVPAGFGPPVLIGNKLNGVLIAGSRNRVLSNRIIHNDLAGVVVTGGADNAVLRNTMQNDGLGIDLGNNGVTPNDPGDVDTGANALQNFPVITAVDSNDAYTTVSGTLNSRPNLAYEIQVFSTGALDPSGYGEGQVYLGSVVVTTNASGNAAFTAQFATVAQGQWITATATRIAGNVSVETSEFSAFAATPAVVARGPRVTAVFVAGSAWANSLMQHLQNTGLGDSQFGFAIPAGPAQLAPLPWANVNKISIRFNEPVSVQQGDLLVRAAVGDDTRPAPQYAFSSFNYDAPTRTATWTLQQAVRADRVQLDLDADGPDPVRDPAGNALDGEWTDGQSAFPSGDRNAGGDFLFRFNVVPGDANRSGVPNVLDEMQVRRRYGAALSTAGAPSARYSIFSDLDANGRINALDVSLVRTRQRRALPVA